MCVLVIGRTPCSPWGGNSNQESGIGSSLSQRPFCFFHSGPRSGPQPSSPRRTQPSPLPVTRDVICSHPDASAEKARNVLAVEATPGELVGEAAAHQPAPGHPNSINFSFKQWGTELKNSMSSFRPGRGHGDSRKSVFYTNEEWELLDPNPKDLEESMAQEERKKPAPEGNKGVTGSGFPFDFGRIPYKGKRPLKDMIGSYRNRHVSGDPSAEGAQSAGAVSRPTSEMQLQVQSQQEELDRLKKDLSSQKELVRLLQHTVRSSQYDKYFASSRLSAGIPKDTLDLLHRKDDQILGLSSQLERLSLERESLQQEARTLKSKVGELSEQLGMLVETIQAKDEVIMKLSRQLSEGTDHTPSAAGVPGSPTPPSREHLELDRLKVSGAWAWRGSDSVAGGPSMCPGLRASADGADVAGLEANYGALLPHVARGALFAPMHECPGQHRTRGLPQPPGGLVSELGGDARELNQGDVGQSSWRWWLFRGRRVAVGSKWADRPPRGFCRRLHQTPAPTTGSRGGSAGIESRLAGGGLQTEVDQRVFRDLMSEKLPRLHTHLEQYGVDYTLITFNWFLVVFVDSVVSDILFKIWDSFLYEGPKVIFRFALALFKYKEEEILKLQDSMSIFKYLRYFTRTILDARKLISISFGDLNPFPLRQIRNRRAYHLEKVRLELTELEAIREDFLRERDTSPDKGELVSDEEEDT
ncbi:TBC1 domain family member 2B [Leptonychotes weddellii]|uniref:TBC1 domain family member 2B n=1 Tax=Leptonychotes weddellii TaxID=9713 RepID=A0A7F8Q7T8_LEPWE|nr:TBC1 domain family member 2B [Leptonychotes weddellii]